MDKMYKEGGLATDGMDIDPVSGNEIPAGSNAVDVRDDVDAKLSEGEYVVPADVVKYFGVSYFEKLRNKAKQGLEEMQEDGRVGGDPVEEDMEEMEEEYTLGGDLASLDGYATGGLVEGMDVDGIIDRVKAAAAKDPSITNMLKAKGIFVEEPQPQGMQQQQAMSEGMTPAQAAPPAIQGQDTPTAFAEGGMVYGEGDYDPQQYSSNFNPYAHTYGFSAESGVTGRAPTVSGAPAAPVAPVAEVAPTCPEGYVWDATAKVCMPVQQTQQKRERDDSNYMPPAKTNPNAWMDKYSYNDPEKLFNESMEKLGVRKEGAEEEEKSFLGSLGDAAKGLLSGGLAGKLVGKFMATRNAAETMANVRALEAMGKQGLADQLRAQNETFVKDSGISLVPEAMRDGDQLYSAVKKEYGANWSTDATQRAGTAPTGLGSRPTAPTTTATTTAPPTSRSSSPSGGSSRREPSGDESMRKAAATHQAKVNETRKKETKSVAASEAKSQPANTKTVGRSNVDKTTGKKTETYSSKVERGGGFAKGGLVKPRDKAEAKPAPKGKRGLAAKK